MSTEPAILPISLAARWAYWLGILAIVLAVLSPLVHRFGLASERFAIPLIGLALLFALLAIIMGIIGIIRANMGSVPVAGGGKALTGLLLGLALLALVVVMILPGLGKPVIHDVTTSPIDPPEFVALAEAHYAGRAYDSYSAYNQLSEGKVSGAYPDIKPFLSDLPQDQVFAAAEKTATEMGWEIADIAPIDGRIEATATTALYGFKDDIVIRVKANPSGGTILDIRSASRVGEGDLGANAARIETFMKTLKTSLES